MGVSSQASSQEVRGSTRKDSHATSDFADAMLLGGRSQGGPHVSVQAPRPLRGARSPRKDSHAPGDLGEVTLLGDGLKRDRTSATQARRKLVGWGAQLPQTLLFT